MSFTVFVSGVLLLCLFGSIVSAYHGRTIEQGSTVFVREEGLDVTHALNAAQGTPLDGIPPLTTIGWWSPGSIPSLTLPSQTRDLSTNYNNFYVAPGPYPGYELSDWRLVCNRF